MNNYDELMIINYGNPSLELLEKHYTSCVSVLCFYKGNLRQTHNKYWSGKVLNQVKQRKTIESKIEQCFPGTDVKKILKKTFINLEEVKDEFHKYQLEKELLN